MISARTISTNVARLFGLTTTAAAPSSAIDHVIDTAFAAFAPSHGEWTASLFDLDFLHGAGRQCVTAYHERALTRAQAATVLAAAWENQLGPAPTQIRKRRLADGVAVAASFLGYVTPAVADTPARELQLVVTTDETTDQIIIKVNGRLHRASYTDFLAQVEQIVARHPGAITLDMRGVRTVELSGLYAIHAIAALARGEAYPTPEQGLAGLRSLAERNFAAGAVANLVVICPAGATADKLHQAGIDRVCTLRSC